MKKILIYGYGNPGRKDDGLGAAFVELVDKWICKEQLDNIFTDCNYQLNIEDAAIVAEYDIVIFVDASVVEDLESFKIEEVKPDNASIEFTMHAVSTSYVIDLSQKIYGKSPSAYVLHIKAYDFDFAEGLTEQAQQNLDNAFDFMKSFIKQNL